MEPVIKINDTISVNIAGWRHPVDAIVRDIKEQTLCIEVKCAYSGTIREINKNEVLKIKEEK